MSVIVYRAGVMAADSRAFLDRYSASPGSKSKIRRFSGIKLKLPGYVLAGVSTPVPGAGEFILKWLEDGADPDIPSKPEDFTALVIREDGKAMVWHDNPYPTGPCEAEFYAIGSGSDYALGAMHMGATARGGVEAACRFDPFCAAPILTLTHKEP